MSKKSENYNLSEKIYDVIVLNFTSNLENNNSIPTYVIQGDIYEPEKPKKKH